MSPSAGTRSHGFAPLMSEIKSAFRNGHFSPVSEGINDRGTEIVLPAFPELVSRDLCGIHRIRNVRGLKHKCVSMTKNDPVIVIKSVMTIGASLIDYHLEISETMS